MKKFWKNTKLKLQLLRIWFFKNIIMFLEIVGITLLILMLTGVIPEDAPILGTIFADLIDSIHKIIEANDINQGVMSFFSAALSIISAVSMFAWKAKSLSINDIKSNKLKLAMVQAGLYFNADGKLVKKVEKATQRDIDGDGKIDDEDVEGVNGPITQAVSAVKEFAIIVSTDFTKEDGVLTDTMEKTNLTKAAEGQKELFNSVEESTVEAVSQAGLNAVGNRINETLDSTESDEVVEKKVSWLRKLGSWFKALPTKWKEYKAKRAEKKAAKIAKQRQEIEAKLAQSKKVEVITNDTTNTKVVETKKEIPATSSVKTAKKSDIKSILDSYHF